jgi:AAA domain
VRLIGDDQQLGAIGAGGVLRDIAATHGALHLDTVMRFADPAEAAATVALRAGDTGALGFYLDHDRIHVVDPDTATTSLITAWQADRNAGLDALMLAPTRNQVADLNHAARTTRLNGVTPGREIILADGNPASDGDVIITRRNNRTLTTSSTAWVRNGDRWAITQIHPDGGLDVQHLKTHAQLTLPAEYVTSSVELGYATTIHAAQGVTADTCHGLLTGTESRQVAYTMLSRGRTANHAWIQVSNVDPHTAPAAQPLLQPFTATQLLEQVIGRDDAPISVTTMRVQADDPVRLLGPAVDCYLDAISFAAERHVSQVTKDSIDKTAQRLGLTEADAWPTLRSHLLLVAANGYDPNGILKLTMRFGSLDTARDPAAVIDYRLDLTHANTASPGPLPWLPGIPTQLLNHPDWGPYLKSRHALTQDLASQTLDAVTDQTPRWAQDLPGLDPTLVDDIRLWRAAHNTPDTDLRPTGPIRWATPERRAQRDLDHRLETAETSIQEWTPRIIETVPTLAGDPRLPALAAQLANLDHNGHDVRRILRTAALAGPLPDDHPADALSYRITHIAELPAPPIPWESYDSPKKKTRPELYEPPPSMRPSRGPSIGF